MITQFENQPFFLLSKKLEEAMKFPDILRLLLKLYSFWFKNFP